MTDIKELNERIQQESAFVDILSMEMNKVIVGQKYIIERLLIGLFQTAIFYWKVFRVWQKHWQ